MCVARVNHFVKDVTRPPGQRCVQTTLSGGRGALHNGNHSSTSLKGDKHRDFFGTQPCLAEKERESRLPFLFCQLSMTGFEMIATQLD